MVGVMSGGVMLTPSSGWALTSRRWASPLSRYHGVVNTQVGHMTARAGLRPRYYQPVRQHTGKQQTVHSGQGQSAIVHTDHLSVPASAAGADAVETPATSAPRLPPLLRASLAGWLVSGTSAAPALGVGSSRGRLDPPMRRACSGKNHDAIGGHSMRGGGSHMIKHSVQSFRNWNHASQGQGCRLFPVRPA